MRVRDPDPAVAPPTSSSTGIRGPLGPPAPSSWPFPAGGPGLALPCLALGCISVPAPALETAG